MLPDRRRLADPRLHEAWAKCPDGDGILVPTGVMYTTDPGIPPAGWVLAFRCPAHPDEVLQLWRPELQPLIDEVLGGIDLSSLPLVGPTEW